MVLHEQENGLLIINEKEVIQTLYSIKRFHDETKTLFIFAEIFFSNMIETTIEKGVLTDVDELEQLYNDLNDFLASDINHPGWINRINGSF